MSSTSLKYSLIVLILAVWLTPSLAGAQIIPFGGKIVHVKWCTCSNNLYINYLPVRPATMPPALSYRPGVSTLFAYYQIYRSGAEILGITMSPDICLTGSHCRPYGPSIVLPPMLIKLVGTSH